MAQPLESVPAAPVPRVLDATAVEQADRLAVERARAGHPEAFEGVVRRHAHGLLALCSRLINDGPLGEDLAQEAFARAFAGLGSYRGQGTFRHWLYSIAANGCRDYLKAGERSEEPCALSGDELESALDPERDTAARQEMSALLAAVAALPPACRTAFVLFHLECLSYEEMSHLTGAHIPALKVRVHRARQLLRRRLGEQAGPEDPPAGRPGRGRRLVGAGGAR